MRVIVAENKSIFADKGTIGSIARFNDGPRAAWPVGKASPGTLFFGLGNRSWDTLISGYITEKVSFLSSLCLA